MEKNDFDKIKSNKEYPIKNKKEYYLEKSLKNNNENNDNNK